MFVSGMTTKLLHSINPLTRFPHYKNHPFFIHHQESQASLLRLVFLSMDKILESRNVESMKKMMLMQEQLFKQQVQELHRLYNLQKKLMNEAENGLKQRKEITETGQSFHVFNTRDDTREASGSNSGESSKILINFDLQTPHESRPSSAHPLDEQKEMKKADDETDLEVDLTLSIGHSTTKQRSKSHLNKCTTLFPQLQESEQSNEVQQFSSSSAKTNKGEECGGYQDNTRPHWLLHDLSLNRT